MRLTTQKRMAARKKKVRRRGLTRMTVSIAVVLLCMVLYTFLWTEIFSLREVRFLGGNNLPVDLLRTVRAGLIGRNILTVPLSGIRDQFMSVPEVRDVTFRRKYFHRLDCYIREREPVALVASGQMLEVDAEGVIIPREDKDGDLDLPVITGIEHENLYTEAGKKRINKALEVLKLLNVFGFSPAEQLSEIHLEKYEVILVWMGTGTLIRMGEGGFLEKVLKLRAVYSALDGCERFPELIDLRFDRQVVVR